MEAEADYGGEALREQGALANGPASREVTDTRHAPDGTARVEPHQRCLRGT